MQVTNRKKTFPFHYQLLLITFLLVPSGLFAQVPAFPGAEGFGAVATGGRGGAVYEVTNLNDGGSGSLRAAVNASGARTVVFRVSGTIALQSRLEINNGNITIAGQTAPGDGICLRNHTFTVDADNVIIRYIRTRLGDEFNVQDDAMNGRYHTNIIIDHCSMSWSVDECVSFYDNENFTLQWCLLNESLYESVHDKGTHGYGGIWGGKGATFHHNLLAHHTSRNPRFCGSRYSNQPDLEKIDHRNNVIYNWGGNSCYGAEGGSYNIVNNYYKYGPATSRKNRIINPNADNGSNAQPAGVWGMFYISDNYVYGYPSTTVDNWTTGVQGPSTEVKETIKLADPVAVPDITEHAAEVAFEHVLANTGAVLPVRDVLDTRIVHETMTGTATYGGAYGTGKGIIDTQTTVGGWPILNSTAAPVDSDHDGMPDDWEDAMGLNKNDPADRNGDKNGNGYTNLEDYLNGLVEAFEYLIRPVNLHVDTIIDSKVTLTWQDFSDNESGFTIERKTMDEWTELASVPANDTTYVDSSVDTHGEFFYRMKAFNSNVESFYTDSVLAAIVATGISELVSGLGIKLNIHPNPFTSVAQISYKLKQGSFIDLALIDLTGRKVVSIASEKQAPGYHTFDLLGDELKSGIYFLQLKTESSTSVSRIMHAK